ARPGAEIFLPHAAAMPNMLHLAAHSRGGGATIRPGSESNVQRLTELRHPSDHAAIHTPAIWRADCRLRGRFARASARGARFTFDAQCSSGAARATTASPV